MLCSDHQDATPSIAEVKLARTSSAGPICGSIRPLSAKTAETLASKFSGDAKHRVRREQGKGLKRIYSAAPEVIGHLIADMIDIGQQLDVKELSALKSLLHQHALTKTMDGKDSGPVNIIES